jgi:hypothetical protein
MSARTAAVANLAVINTKVNKGHANLIPVQPGEVRNPRGRPLGSRNKLSEDFLRDAHEAWCLHGRAAFQTLAIEEPAKFVALIASLMPKQFDIATETATPVEELSDEQLTAIINGHLRKAGIDAGDLNGIA